MIRMVFIDDVSQLVSILRIMGARFLSENGATQKRMEQYGHWKYQCVFVSFIREMSEKSGSQKRKHSITAAG